MKSVFIAASMVAATLTFTTVSASADDSKSCRELASQTQEAMKAATGDTAEARRESTAGMQACNFGQYANGASHYHKALSLLGK